MEKFDSEKLIARIEDAKDWLDKAKAEYKSENPVRGGLILNLAQAEVKNAWELSHSQFVSKSNQKPVPIRKYKYFFPVAASLVLLTSVVLVVKIGGKMVDFSPWRKPALVNTVQSQSPLSKKVQRPEVVSSNQKTALMTVNQSDPEPQENLTKSQPETKLQIVETKPVAQIRDSAPAESGGQNSTPTKVLLKPVSQLSIDEEALTKEASHSLRNGK